MTCCGEDITTPYCANCGKRMIANPVQDVLFNLRKHYRAAVTRASKNDAHYRWKEIAEKYKLQIEAIEKLVRDSAFLPLERVVDGEK